MRLRTVAVSAVLVLGAGVAATACSSPDGGPASEGKSARTAVRPATADPCAVRHPDAKDCVVEMPADLEIETARGVSGTPHLEDPEAGASSEGSPTPAPDPGFAETEIGEPADSGVPTLP
ncbi:hypothetical protein [Streptomyces sp. NRRL F-5630]|uniref:hypothetical protein n=1 Tax=unclassified Streptomyces TaxID=2593676 RepID=UPI0004CAD73F|nr:hypothetical protein [Streptomyces sp. NRRL F-5630]